MKTIIAGSRQGFILEDVYRAVNLSEFPITEVISGTANGADRLGEKYAMENLIPIKRFPADWSLGKHAGMIRNKEMAEYGEQLIALWNGSPGTKNMIETAKDLGLRVYVYKKEQ